MTNSGSREAMQAIGHDAGTDDDYCAPKGKAELDRVDAVKFTRLDVVAYGWDIKRHPGGDEDHLARRIRRATVNVLKAIRPVIPPLDWEPPKTYKRGEPWIWTYPTTTAD